MAQNNNDIKYLTPIAVDTKRKKYCRFKKNRIMQAWQRFRANQPHDFPEIFGDGHAAEFMLENMLKAWKK